MGFPMAASTASLACLALARPVAEPVPHAVLVALAAALSCAALGWLAQDALDHALRGRGRCGR